MNQKPSATDPKALVVVFEDLKTAKTLVENYHDAGFPLDRIELVTHNVHSEAPEVETPEDHETTESSMLESTVKWGGVGAGAGLLAGLLTTFPGLALGMAIMGGMTGAIMGGMAGVDHAVEDDSVDVPTLEEYEQLVKDGHSLVVLLGDHEDVLRAKDIAKNTLHLRSHIHMVHSHLYHEHPAHQAPGNGS
ncbi:hypothetical protein [Mariniblastus fucicola]|uniref:DUF1269 domain-containing protein n=1 Tax=Mariniblastus fucicola TaxID=980251 RepID=A0A5B9PHK9_9BACT|nr:hypothetical protein [Mariniblastus fucicola]QEG24755.1 hypothetical protein MFFC18_46770 [Mariniblastus fucicola]